MFWLPFLCVSIIFVLILMVTTQSKSKRYTRDQKKELDNEKTARMVLGSFFWVLIFLFILGIVMHYLGYDLSSGNTILPMQ
jgi:uncharacterized membrane protein YhaH (DUF805 family)